MIQACVTRAYQVIQAGGLLIYPTEGVYGIGCDPHNSEAINKLINLKKRNPNKGIILIASDFAMFEAFIKPLSNEILEQISKYKSDPVSWIVPATEHCPGPLTGNRSTLAIRVSSHPFVQSLCKQLGHAITSTSANVSGQNPINNAKELNKAFGFAVDYIVPLPVGSLGKPTPLFDAISGQQLR